MLTLSVGFELTATTQGKCWMSETDLQVPWKGLYIGARGRGQRNKAELKRKERCI